MVEKRKRSNHIDMLVSSEEWDILIEKSDNFGLKVCQFSKLIIFSMINMMDDPTLKTIIKDGKFAIRFEEVKIHE